jgi:hypothetical protein
MLILLEAFRPALNPTKLAIQWETIALARGWGDSKRLEREADQPPGFSADFKTE